MSDMTLETYRANLNVGARGYLFYWRPNIPGGDDATASKLVRSTSLPTSTINTINIPWQGYQYKIGGRHEYAEWSVTLTMDSPDMTRTPLLTWMNMKIHNPKTNLHGIPTDYFATQQVELIDPYSHAPTQTYHLVDAWPSSVSEIALDYSSTDVATYSVTFAYQYFTIDGVN